MELIGSELELVTGKRGATRLRFALLLRFCSECSNKFYRTVPVPATLVVLLPPSG